MIDLISKYRNVLMGWATLFIILGHTIFYGSNYVYYGPILHQIIRYGCIGVDMFLFLSGFGLVYSIRKHPVAVFYKNRISRLLPSLTMLALFICAWFIVIGSPASICNIYMWTSFWFLNFIILMYIVFPFLYKFFERSSGFASLLSMTILSIACLIPYILNGNAVNCNADVCAICRIPIFCMGAIYAMGKCEILDNVYFEVAIALIGILILTLFAIPTGDFSNEVFTCYYTFILTTPPIVFGLCQLSNYTHTHTLNEVLSNVGKYSLEIYVVQVTIMPKIIRYGAKYSISAWYIVPISILLVVVISYAIGTCSNILREKLKLHNDKTI